jgi:hypothetical protein
MEYDDDGFVMENPVFTKVVLSLDEHLFQRWEMGIAYKMSKYKQTSSKLTNWKNETEMKV